MLQVLSTRLLGNHRLTTVWLNRIWDAHIPLIEFYCGRQHLDYRDKGQITELGHWFRDSKLKVYSAHSPVHNDAARGLSGPASYINITEPAKAKRIQMVDEIKRAIEVTETIPFRYFIQHMGWDFEEFDERKVDSAFTALEELNIFARQRGVEILLQNMNSGMASAEKLYYFNSVTHLNLKYSLDTGQAAAGNGIAAELEVMKPNVRTVHIHDNNGKEDAQLLPSSVDWRKTVSLLRRDAPEAALVLEGPDRYESASPLDDARRTLDYLENLKPLDEEENRH
jgi:sugar phosphate isomerase/epimerase